MYSLEELDVIRSVIRDFVFFAQPKYKIAGTRPGSGNTKNIGSVITTDQLLQGTGPFAQLGEEVYDDYWMHYLTVDMARAAETPRPYIDLKTYIDYKSRGIDILKAHIQEIQTLNEADVTVTEEDEGEQNR